MCTRIVAVLKEFHKTYKKASYKRGRSATLSQENYVSEKRLYDGERKR